MYTWNCDESGIQDVPKEMEVLGINGEKMNNVTSKKPEETSTILTFVNAVGVAFPPVVIHMGGKVLDTWKYVHLEMSKSKQAQRGGSTRKFSTIIVLSG